MTFPEIAKHRLIQQQLAGTEITSVGDMVAFFGAVQAQEYAHTKWSLGLRLPWVRDQDVEQAFAGGEILRLHVLRPTWHFVAASDIRWLLMLSAPRVHAANAFMYRKLELDSALFNRCHDIIVRTLEGGRQLTRSALNEAFKRNGIMAEGMRLAYILMHAELDGIVCSGARAGNQFTYALLEERVPGPDTKTPDEALAELTRRYFLSRGPATVKDYSTWSGLTVKACKAGVETVKSALHHEQVNGEVYYFGTLAARNQPRPAIYLLPLYDELIMGYKSREPSLQLLKRLNAPWFPFDSTIMQDGQLIGSWRRTIHKKRIELEYALLQPPDEAQRTELEKTIRRLEEFTGLSVHNVLP